MALTSADIQAALLQGDDFGFEIRVGRAIAEVAMSAPVDKWDGTSVEQPLHAGTYTDSVTGKPRQFDYRCRVLNLNLNRSYENQTARGAFLAIECKNLFSDCPLVVSGTARTDDESFYCIVDSWRSDFNPEATKHEVRVVKPSQSLYRENEFVGKNLSRVRDKNGKIEIDSNNDVYDKWAQAVASSVELIDAAAYGSADFNCARFLTLVLPIVVVPDGTLWRVVYDDAGAIQQPPTLVQECEYYIGRKLPDRRNFIVSHIHFVTLAGLKLLIERFWKRHSTWRQILNEPSEKS